MKLIILLYVLSFLAACKKEDSASHKNETTDTNPVTINIVDAILNPQEEIILSELADSISYIPLETKKECLLKNFPFFSFTSSYIAYCNYCFDWSGKFKFKVGKRGQGPGEDPAEILTNPTFFDGNFYTCGQKIIKYDSLGIFTGKERSLYSIDKSKDAIYNNNLAWVVAFKSSKGKLLLYNYPDTLFIMDKNLEYTAKHSVMPWNNNSYPYFLSLGSPSDQYITTYRETALLYNYFRDTVSQITEKNLDPRWIIKLDKLKVSEEVLYNFDELYGKAFKDYKNNCLDSTPLAKLMDHKYMITSVHESNQYVFITASEIIALREIRKIPKSSPILIYYNKKTKEIKSTKKIRDDLTGYPNFFPKLGLEGEKMIDFFWPYDQEEWLREKAETDPRFKSFKGRDFSEDNPVIIAVHLKK